MTANVGLRPSHSSGPSRAMTSGSLGASTSSVSSSFSDSRKMSPRSPPHFSSHSSLPGICSGADAELHAQVTVRQRDSTEMTGTEFGMGVIRGTCLA